MQIPLYQVDAFATRVFEGNPAAVCLLDGGFLHDATMQAIAAENALSETAFVVPDGDGFGLRWFTPSAEVDLCGHATLAAAHVLFTEQGVAGDGLRFETRSGELRVERRGARLALDLPALVAAPCGAPADLVAALGRAPREVLRGVDYVAVYDHEEEVRALTPDLARLAALDARGAVVTAPGRDVDFVSRYFAPAIGIPEDPVTGSTHGTLALYWSERLGLRKLRARQLSRRGGELSCRLDGDRVVLLGHAVTYLRGVIELAPVDQGRLRP